MAASDPILDRRTNKRVDYAALAAKVLRRQEATGQKWSGLAREEAEAVTEDEDQRESVIRSLNRHRKRIEEHTESATAAPGLGILYGRISERYEQIAAEHEASLKRFLKAPNTMPFPQREFEIRFRALQAMLAVLRRRLQALEELDQDEAGRQAEALIGELGSLEPAFDAAALVESEKLHLQELIERIGDTKDWTPEAIRQRARRDKG